MLHDGFVDSVHVELGFTIVLMPEAFFPREDVFADKTGW
jgi:hypothetical protein